MRVRFVWSVLWTVAAAAVLSAAFLSAKSASAQNPPEMERIPFQIATGPVSGSYLALGDAVAAMISHPPGLGRCESKNICGPEGLIATTRSSSGSESNAFAVARKQVQSAFLQGDVARMAAVGSGPFQDGGPLSDLRVIARLHDEALHIVVSNRSKIRKLKDLSGRRIAIDSSNSSTEYAVLALLDVAGVKATSVKIKRVSVERAAEDLKNGKIDALFVLGVAPVRVVDQLIRRTEARLLAVDTKLFSKLSRRNAFYSKIVLEAGAYRGSKATLALGVASLWVVNSDLPADTVNKILQAFWQKENQADLRRRGKFASTISLKKSLQIPSVPLHEGAKRFYAGHRS